MPTMRSTVAASRNDGGARTVNPRSAARRATGVCASRWPRSSAGRPTVTTPTTRTSGSSTSASRIGTPKEPEPKNRVRVAAGGSGESAGRLPDLLVGRLILADRDQLLHRVEVVDEQFAVEMVELVLERARQQPDADRKST